MHLTFDQVNKFFVSFISTIDCKQKCAETAQSFHFSLKNSTKSIKINELGWSWKNLIVQTGTFFHRGIVNRWKSINESVTMKIVAAMILISEDCSGGERITRLFMTIAWLPSTSSSTTRKEILAWWARFTLFPLVTTSSSVTGVPFRRSEMKIVGLECTTTTTTSRERDLRSVVN